MNTTRTEPLAKREPATKDGSLPASTDLTAELRAYREGGMTEEILRRNDGCIKVSNDCAFVLLSDWNELKQLKANLRECPDPLSRDRDDHLAPSETEYYKQSGIPTGEFRCANCGKIARWQLSASECRIASRDTE